MLRKLHLILIQSMVSMTLLGQVCPCPSIESISFDEVLCGGVSLACVEFDGDISCVDTLIIFTADNTVNNYIQFARDEASNQICLEVAASNNSCDPIFTNISIMHVCNIDTIIETIVNVKIFPLANQFFHQPFGGGWDNPEPCSGAPQLNVTECPADFIIERIPGQSDACDSLVDGAFIWTSFPLFDLTGGEHCYSHLTDTIVLPACPIYPSNGIPSIKIISK